MLGYLYQVRFALLRLLLASKDDQEVAVSIEQLDDVTIEADGTPSELIQLKHSAVERPGDLTDASADIWKTLRIWCTFVSDGLIDVSKTTFTLVTTASAGMDSVASKLQPTNRDEEAALEALINTAGSSRSQENGTAYRAFLDLDPVLRKQLISNIQVLDGSGTIVDVNDLIEKELWFVTSPDHLDYFQESLEGWWNKRVVKQLFRGSHEIISALELRNQIDDLRQQFDLELNLPNNFPDPLDVDVDELPQDLRVFVEQLRLLFDKDVRIRKATSDYFRAVQQRTLWISKGVLFNDDLERYEVRLKDEWERQFERMREVLESKGGDDEKRIAGRDLFYWMDGEADIRIKPRFDDPFLMRGSYHELANRLKVGWHADFLERLRHLVLEAAQ